MEYIQLDARIGSLPGVLSPARYLERLPLLAGGLPAGARDFAAAPDHYDFSSKRCVKDLELRHIRSMGAGDRQMEVRFRHNCWKHDEDLIVRYTGVCGFNAASTDGGGGWAAFGAVILDEVLPHENGCSVARTGHPPPYRP